MTVAVRRQPSAVRVLRAIGGWLATGSLAGAVLVVTSVAPAGAAGVGGSRPFALTPSSLANGQSRPYFNLTVAAGRSVSDTVIVTNRSTTAETLKVSPSTGITAPDSASAFADYFQPCVATGCWVRGLPPLVTLGPGASKAFSFRVTVPAGTPPKQYLAGVTAEPSTPSAPVVIGRNGGASAQAVVVDQVSVGVAVTVGSLPTLRTSLTIPTVTGGSLGSIPRLFVHLHNAGQTFTKANGTAACVVRGRTSSFRVSSDTVLPAEGAVIPVNALAVGLGATVPCTVVLGYGPGLTVRWSGMITTPAGTAATVVRTGQGTFSNLPVSHGIPSWAIALIALGALVLASMAAMVLWLNHRRRLLPPGTAPTVP